MEHFMGARTDIPSVRAYLLIWVFVRNKKLFFTHKPLEAQNNYTSVESYQNLIKTLSEHGDEVRKTLILLAFSDFSFYSHSMVAGGLPEIS